MSATPPADRPEPETGSITLSRVCWSITAFGLFLVGLYLLLHRGDVGYAIVTLVIALAAGINLL